MKQRLGTTCADHGSSTCQWIQEMYGISNSTLYANNPQINGDCSNIYVGEVLCVDTAAYSYPAYNTTLYEVSCFSRMGRASGG